MKAELPMCVTVDSAAGAQDQRQALGWLSGGRDCIPEAPRPARLNQTGKPERKPSVLTSDLTAEGKLLEECQLWPEAVCSLLLRVEGLFQLGSMFRWRHQQSLSPSREATVPAPAPA